MRIALKWMIQAAELRDLAAQGIVKRLHDAMGLEIPPVLPCGDFLRNIEQPDYPPPGESFMVETLSFEPNIHLNPTSTTSLLHLSAYLGLIEACQSLLQHHNISINSTNDRKETALHFACKGGKSLVINLLLSERALLTVYSNKNVTPLHYAVISSNPEIIENLLNQGAAVDASSMYGYDEMVGACEILCSTPRTPLHWAVGRNDAEAVGTLLSRGANPHLKNCN